MYYQDFTYYRRFHYENAVNIGFCPTGPGSAPAWEADSPLIRKLAGFLEHPVNMIRGGSFRPLTLNGKAYTLGFAEMRIIGPEGTVYAAPNQLVADLLEGCYQPPQAFVDAVLYGAFSDGPAYRDYLARYDEAHLWGARPELRARAEEAASVIRSGQVMDLDRLHRASPVLELVTLNGSLLGEAIAARREDMAQWCLEAGIDLARFEGDELLRAIDAGMETTALALIDRGIPLHSEEARVNPLFVAVARGQNRVAAALYRARKDLVQTYRTAAIPNCNLLQWAKQYQNREFLQFLNHPYGTR